VTAFSDNTAFAHSPVMVNMSDHCLGEYAEGHRRGPFVSRITACSPYSAAKVIWCKGL